MSGGKWQKETHDYHSLPLMIRPNTVLALGNNDQKPDYDYADGVSLLVSAFDEGAEAKTEIPDLKGETVMTVTAKRVGDEIHLHVEGGNGNYTVRSLSGCKVVGSVRICGDREEIPKRIRRNVRKAIMRK